MRDLQPMPGAPYRLREMLEVFARDPTSFLPPVGYSEQQVENFVTFGSLIASRDVPIHRLAAVRKWIEEVAAASGPRAVFMDTTAIAGLTSTLFPNELFNLASESMLDLSNFVTSFVLYDQIFHLKNSRIDSLIGQGVPSQAFSVPTRSLHASPIGQSVSIGAGDPSVEFSSS